MNIVVIELGSNIDPDVNTAAAIAKLKSRYKILGVSGFIKTAPIGNTEQPDYLNGAVVLETEENLTVLKAHLKEIESEMGRAAGKSCSPREMDLDIIVWNGEVIHKDYADRDFVRDTVHDALRNSGRGFLCKE